MIWNKKNEIDMSLKVSDILQNFLKYRQTKLIKSHPNDNAQLLSNEPFGNTVVGLAPVGEMCSPSQSGGVSTDHSKFIAIVAATVAHEMGHNFGMEHDDPTCSCQDDNGCIMMPQSSYHGFNQWSSCSINKLREKLKSGIDVCLKNKPEKLFSSPTCGNGFVEPGEQCDCGLAEICNNPCCDPSTCMFTVNATCATGSCCDLSTCNLKQSGIFHEVAGDKKVYIFFFSGNVCRKASGECDLPEVCNGKHEFCPDDVYKHDSVECGLGKAYCYQGQCQSHDDECRKFWGPTSRSLEKCYSRVNTRGDDFGNCGYDQWGKTKPCSKSDSMCGMLQCNSVKGSLEFKKIWIGRTSFNDVECSGAKTVSTEVALVPEGAKCGESKVCYSQKCIAVDILKAKCANCNGHGVCNSKGNCHCDEGWAPPFCKDSGAGGSIDSGEMTNDSSKCNSVQKL